MRHLLIMLLALMGLNAYAQDCCRGANPLEGKTINVIGDSYVRNHRRPYTEAWHYLVAERNGMRYNNYGRNGNCIAFDRTAEGFGNPMTERYAQMSDSADVVLVIAGHNDADKIKDNPDSLQMFRAGLVDLCDKLVAKYPAARIAFVTPWRVPRDGFEQVTATILDVCAQYGFPCLDATTTGGIEVWNDDFRARYFQAPKDTAHLNADGHELFYPTGLQFILGLFAPRDCCGGCCQ